MINPHQADPVEAVTCRLRQSGLLSDNSLAQRLEAWNLRAAVDRVHLKALDALTAKGIVLAKEAADHIATLETHLAHMTEVAGKLATAATSLKKDLLMRGEREKDGTVIVNVSQGRWMKFCDALTAYEQSQPEEPR